MTRLREGLHRAFRRGCNGRTFHVWSEDPRTISDSSLFHRVDCIYCDYAMNGVQAKQVYEHLGWFPGRLAEPDELKGKT